MAPKQAHVGFLRSDGSCCHAQDMIMQDLDLHTQQPGAGEEAQAELTQGMPVFETLKRRLAGLWRSAFQKSASS